MNCRRLDASGLAAIEAAVRSGEPVRLASGLRSRVPMDEIVPFCHGVDDPALAVHLAPPAQARGDIAVSVVIPTHRRRPLALAALAAQDVRVEVHVLVNGDAPADVEGVRVPWEGHGTTRNRGAAIARHAYVLLTVDDALPLGAGFVRTLVEALESGGFDAVSARQIPWPTADPVTRARLRAWTPPLPAPCAAPPVEGGVLLDNVCALYRREALLADPFDAVPIAEDWRWGRRHRVGYAPQAPVAHSHPRRFRALFQRTRDIHAERIRAGEAPTVPDLASLARALPTALGADARGALGELLGQYAATRRR
jgi:hypothetical protein